MYKRVILIHGIAGIERESFFPHLKITCENLGLKVFMPSLGGYRQNITYKDWKDFFDKNLKDEFNEETIVVSQSLGTQFIIKYLAETNLDIGLFISCAGPYNVLDTRDDVNEKVTKVFVPIAKNFMPTDDEYNLIKNKDFEKFSLFSDNDMFFEQVNLEKYAEAIGATSIFVEGKGHFNFNANVYELSELEELIKKCMGANQ